MRRVDLHVDNLPTYGAVYTDNTQARTLTHAILHCEEVDDTLRQMRNCAGRYLSVGDKRTFNLIAALVDELYTETYGALD